MPRAESRAPKNRRQGAMAVILAGARGANVLVDGRPVPRIMLPLGGKPLLGHQLAWLSAQGVESAVLSLGGQAEGVRDRFGDGSGFGLKLQYSIVQDPLGTAGAVKALGPASLPDNILILSGDAFPEAGCRDLLAFHARHGGLATVAVHKCPASHECVRAVLGPSRRIEEFPLRAGAPGTVGISPLWIIRREILHLVPDSGPSDFLRDVFPEALRRGEILVAGHEAGPMADVGDPAGYERLQRRLAAGTAK